MNFPVFVFHELVVRLDQLNPIIGRYLSFEELEDTFILTTFNGTVVIPLHFLQMQYENPDLISQTDLSILANNFKAY